MKTQPGDSGTLWVFDHEFDSQEAGREKVMGTRARRYRPWPCNGEGIPCWRTGAK